MAKWDLSKLPEGRKPLPDEWFAERAQMQYRIKELEANLAKAVELVERAFNEGFGEGMNDLLRQSGGKTWYDSRSRKRLAELTGGKDE